MLLLISMTLFVLSCNSEDKFFMIQQSPEKYQGKEVEIVGLLRKRAGNYVIYRIEWDTIDIRNAMSVEFSDILMMINSFEGGQDMKWKIRGIFNLDNKGPNRNFFGSVEEAILIKVGDVVVRDE